MTEGGRARLDSVCTTTTASRCPSYVIPDVSCCTQLPTGGRSEAMDQPTAEEALKRLEPLVGEWRCSGVSRSL
jgi:hypothetical protein